MAAKSPEEIVHNINQIGSLPQTLMAVLKTVNRQNVTTDEIADIISKDVSLTTRVLRMVNSTRYARHSRITKISEAVKVMGLNSIKMLTLSSSVFGMLPDDQQVEHIDFKRIWRHMIGTATSAKSIAIEAEYEEPEEAFIAGILHDVGIVVMILNFKNDYHRAVTQMQKDNHGLPEAEQKLFGFTHCDVGAELARQWKLPARFEFVMGNHHNINNPCPVECDARLNEIVSLADRLTQGPFDDYYPNLQDNIAFIQAVCKNLGMDSNTAHRIRKESLTQTIQLAEYLEIDVGNVLDIMIEANTQLAEMYFQIERIYLEKLNAVANAESPIKNRKNPL
jgi:HD-like signal output (HDOD) protein